MKQVPVPGVFLALGLLCRHLHHRPGMGGQRPGLSDWLPLFCLIKNWMRQKNTLEYLGLWERLYNPAFKGVEFDPLLAEAGSNSFTMSPTRWIEITGAIGIVTKSGAGG